MSLFAILENHEKKTAVQSKFNEKVQIFSSKNEIKMENCLIVISTKIGSAFGLCFSEYFYSESQPPSITPLDYLT